MNFEIIWGDRNIYIKFKGHITIKDIIAVNRKITGNSKYGLLKCNITDFTEADSLYLTNNDIEFIAALHTIPTIWNPNMKLSIVSNIPDLQELILHYIELMKENEWKIKLMETLEEAEKWCKCKIE